MLDTIKMRACKNEYTEHDEQGRLITSTRVVMRIADWDRLCDMQLENGKGFRITEPGKTDLDERGGRYSIHSPLYGTDFNDENPYETMWSCQCGKLTGRAYADNKTVCPKCGQLVEYVDVDLEVNGWIILDRDWVIQPEFYKKLLLFIGSPTLQDIIIYKDPDKRGNDPDNPFEGIGMTEFRKRFDEVMNFYLEKHSKKPNKKVSEYLFIMSRVDLVWVHCIPVFNKFLRGFYVTDTDVKYSKEDRVYKKIFSDHQALNDDFVLSKKQDNIRKRRKYKYGTVDSVRPNTIDYVRRENILYRIQESIDAIWDLSFASIGDKKGIIHSQITGGRSDYTSRTVIVPDPTLRQDQVGFGYLTFAELLKYQIVQHIIEMYKMSEPDAWDMWSNALYEFDPHVYTIMTTMIKSRNLYVTPGRNPSINYGSETGAKIVKVDPDIQNGNCLFISSLILVKPNADFDGDIMFGILHIIEKYGKVYYDALNPSDNFIISKNTGKIDRDMMLKKDLSVGWFAFNNI